MEGSQERKMTILDVSFSSSSSFFFKLYTVVNFIFDTAISIFFHLFLLAGG